jgi:hypothetical protein
VPPTSQAIRNIFRRYQQGGLERARYERQRPGAAEVLHDSQKQRLIAMVCSSPPEGRARWTARLVAEEAVGYNGKSFKRSTTWAVRNPVVSPVASQQTSAVVNASHRPIHATAVR